MRYFPDKIFVKIIILLFLGCAAFIASVPRPVLYIIGDSTVRNGNGNPDNVQQGWGSFISAFFDTTKISIQNLAIGGRSSRTFITDGRWASICAKLKPGDYVLMQFGHNDAGPLDDTARARGTLKGIGNETKEVYNPIRKQKEVVYTYGHYMRSYVNDAKGKGAIPIVCSPVPRYNWKNGKIVRVDSTYGQWANQIAVANAAFFIDLNSLIAGKYETMDTVKVKSFFPEDHTHTNKEGAVLNAKEVIIGIRKLKKCSLQEYLSNK